MKYLMAITLAAFGFASFTPTSAQAIADCTSKPDWWHCNPGERRDPHSAEVDDVDPLTETAFEGKQGGADDENSGESGGGDFGEGDKAAASTAAE